MTNTTVHQSDEPFIERSITQITPTRDSIHGSIYGSHMAITWPQVTRREMILLVGYRVDHAYNLAVTDVLEKLKTTYIFTLEDDMIVPNFALNQLLDKLEAHPEFAAVSALYNTKVDPPKPLVLGDPRNGPEDATPLPGWKSDELVETNILPMGCALWRTSLFRDITAPQFATTHLETQDVYFCRRARRKGHRFAVDTSLVVGHRDARTGKVY